jgi:hypothetical protein
LPARANRYALLAICAAVSACLGAVGGSAGIASLAPALWAAAPVREAPDELRPLKEAVAQLRAHIKSVGDNVAALRANFTTSSSAANAQLSKIVEQVDKVERAHADRRAATSALPDVAGTVTGDTKSSPPAKPPVVEGWVVRRVFDGAAALVESRHGVIEVEPGDSVPGVGRIQEIKRQDGRWVVVTAKGLIVPVR